MMETKGAVMGSPRWFRQMIRAAGVIVMVCGVPAWSAEENPLAKAPNLPELSMPATSHSAEAAASIGAEAPRSSAAAPADVSQMSEQIPTTSNDATEAAPIGKPRRASLRASKRSVAAAPHADPYPRRDSRSRSCSGAWCGARLVLILGVAY